VVGSQVHKVATQQQVNNKYTHGKSGKSKYMVSQTVHGSRTRTLYALAALGVHSPSLLHWLHLLSAYLRRYSLTLRLPESALRPLCLLPPREADQEHTWWIGSNG
jgi:hypothetical protein